jgi:hypothetical protein
MLDGQVGNPCVATVYIVMDIQCVSVLIPFIYRTGPTRTTWFCISIMKTFLATRLATLSTNDTVMFGFRTVFLLCT